MNQQETHKGETTEFSTTSASTSPWQTPPLSQTSMWGKAQCGRSHTQTQLVWRTHRVRRSDSAKQLPPPPRTHEWEWEWGFWGGAVILISRALTRQRALAGLRMDTHDAVDTAPPPSPQVQSSSTTHPDADYPPVAQEVPPEHASEIEARSDAEARLGEISGRDRRAGVCPPGSHPLHAWIDPIKPVCRFDCKNMSLEELKTLAERRECMRSIEASRVYTRDEMAGFKSASVEDLRDAKEKARLVLQLSEPSTVEEAKDPWGKPFQRAVRWSMVNYCGILAIHILLVASDPFRIREGHQEWLDWTWSILMFLPELFTLGWQVTSRLAVDPNPNRNLILIRNDSQVLDIHRYFIDFLGFAAVFLGTLRDDGFSLFVATSTAVLFIFVRGIDDPSESQVWWILSNPFLLLVASIDVWLTRFDKAALDRILKHVPFIKKMAETTDTFSREAAPDLEDISVKNGLRAANLLRTRYSARFFWHMAASVQMLGAVAYALPLADLGGRLSNVDQRGMDILRITTAVYGALSSLVGTMRLHRRPTFNFTVRLDSNLEGGFTRRRALFLGKYNRGVWTDPKTREAKLLLRLWTVGVDWLAVQIGLVIMCEEEFAYFEGDQIDKHTRRLRSFYPY